MKNIKPLFVLFFLFINSIILKAADFESIKSKELIEEMSKSQNVINYIKNDIELIVLKIKNLKSDNENNKFEEIKTQVRIEASIKSHNNYYALILNEFEEFKNLNSIEKKEIFKSLIPRFINFEPTAVSNLESCIWSALSGLSIVLDLSVLAEYSYNVCIGISAFVDILFTVASAGFDAPLLPAELGSEVLACASAAVAIGTDGAGVSVEEALKSLPREITNCAKIN